MSSNDDFDHFFAFDSGTYNFGPEDYLSNRTSSLNSWHLFDEEASPFGSGAQSLLPLRGSLEENDLLLDFDDDELLQSGSAAPHTSGINHEKDTIAFLGDPAAIKDTNPLPFDQSTETPDLTSLMPTYTESSNSYSVTPPVTERCMAWRSSPRFGETPESDPQSNGIFTSSFMNECLEDTYFLRLESLTTDSTFPSTSRAEHEIDHQIQPSECLSASPECCFNNTHSPVGCGHSKKSQQKPPDRTKCTRCSLKFGRKADLERHIKSIHSRHLSCTCSVSGCTNNKGKGYSRMDKLREHQWRKHGELGYRKTARVGRNIEFEVEVGE